MSEPTMDDMCTCGKNYGDHIGPRCPDGSGTSFTDAAYVAEIAAAEERGRLALREKIVKALGCAATASDDDLARGVGSLVLAVHDLNRKCRHLTEDVKSGEERGRRSGIEEGKLGTCRVYRHGCTDGRAIKSELSDRWRDYALPHPKRNNCLEWVALAPRDSGKEG